MDSDLNIDFDLINTVNSWVKGESEPLCLETFYEKLGYYGHTNFDHDNSMKLFIQNSLSQVVTRDEFIHKFGFSIPVREAIIKAAQFSPLVEVGAGTGMWSNLITRMDGMIYATDKFLKEENRYGFSETYFPIEQIEAADAVRSMSDRNVFCSWPNYGEDWLGDAARVMKSGKILVVIREDCTGCEETWEYLENNFTKIDNQEIPCFFGIHDIMEIWQKNLT